MTRRALLTTLAGLATGLLVSGSPSAVSAQKPTTQEGMKDKAKASAKKGAVAWDSMNAEQQDAMKTAWKADAAKSKAQWNALTPEQQEKAISEAKGMSQDAKKKWQALPKQ